MQEKHLFEYAVIRIVPRVEREEFINTGVIVYCAAQGFLQTVYELNVSRLQAIAGGLDLPELETRLRAFEQICKGGAQSGPIGLLPIAARFRWLTSPRSTIVQTSTAHPGFCIDPKDTLSRLYAQLVQY